MKASHSVTFFDNQFRKQVANSDYALNPFEESVLPFVRGHILDLGCGLGNLSITAARKFPAATTVAAVDASPTAIKHIEAVAKTEKLKIVAICAAAESFPIAVQFDTIVSIGLLMFFKRDTALRLLTNIKRHIAPGGTAIINVLTEGTTYTDMFDADNYYLFGRDELAYRFKGWDLLLSRHDTFDAPGNTRKVFSTVVARLPISTGSPKTS